MRTTGPAKVGWDKRATRAPAHHWRYFHRWAGAAYQPLVPPYERAVFIAILLFLFVTGCGERTADPELSFTKFDTWKVPASGSFLPAPRGLYADEHDNVYVLDDAGRVLVYNSQGKLEKQWEMLEFAAG